MTSLKSQAEASARSEAEAQRQPFRVSKMRGSRSVTSKRVGKPATSVPALSISSPCARCFSAHSLMRSPISPAAMNQ